MPAVGAWLRGSRAKRGAAFDKPIQNHHAAVWCTIGIVGAVQTRCFLAIVRA